MAKTLFETIIEEDNFQVRKYDPVWVAKTNTQEEKYEIAIKRGFKRLFSFISGKTNNGAVKIPMTSPVLAELNNGYWTIAFILPSPTSHNQLPSPLDQNIEIEEKSNRLTATIRYAGRNSQSLIQSKFKELQVWTRERDLKTTNTFDVAGYSPPWVIPLLRRNELNIPILKS